MKIIRLSAFGALTLACSLVANAQNAVDAVKKAQYALGMIRSPQRIDAIGTMEYWGTGSAYSYGQQFKPDGAWPPMKVTYHASISYQVPAMRVDMMRSNPDGPYQGGGGLPFVAPQRQVQVVSGGFSWNEPVPGGGFIKGTTATPAPGTVEERMLQFWSTPHGSLKAAALAGANTKVTTENGRTVLTFPLPGSLSAVNMKITLNAKDQPEKIEVRRDDPVLGDIVAETVYTDY